MTLGRQIKEMGSVWSEEPEEVWREVFPVNTERCLSYLDKEARAVFVYFIENKRREGPLLIGALSKAS